MLTFIRTLHTVIYLVQVTCIFTILYCGIAGSFGWPLYVSLILVGIEVVVFTANGLKCPITTWAVKHGAEKGYTFDTFLPEKFSQYTFRFFGSLFFVSLLLVTFRWFEQR